MSEAPMKVEYPYVHPERMASGRTRYRWNRNGRKVTMKGAPGSPEFVAMHEALMAGTYLKAERDADRPAERSLAWLVSMYLADLARDLRKGKGAASTLKQKRSVLNRVVAEYGEDNGVPNEADALTPEAVRRIMHAHRDRPAAADHIKKSLASMYKWARTAGLSTADPCAGVENIDTSSAGFRVWTTADLHRFFSHHPPGTTARLTLQLALWTGLRRGDICRLSRAMIKSVDGIEYLSVDTEKTGAIVEIPIMPPLRQAIASPPAGDFVFLLNRLGRPYSKEVLGNEFREWCKEAGVSGRLHGIRKALGGLLADAGCSSYEIAAILGHEKISTTEIYTKTANRRRLARDGFEKLRGLEW